MTNIILIKSRIRESNPASQIEGLMSLPIGEYDLLVLLLVHKTVIKPMLGLFILIFLKIYYLYSAIDQLISKILIVYQTNNMFIILYLRNMSLLNSDK